MHKVLIVPGLLLILLNGFLTLLNFHFGHTFLGILNMLNTMLWVVITVLYVQIWRMNTGRSS